MTKLNKFLSKKARPNILQFDIFVYDGDGQGFTLMINSKATHFQWADIETAFGYKIDLITYDEIGLDVFSDKGLFFSITASNPGWRQFNQLLACNIRDMLSDWETNLVQPPFATNMTLLFDKKGRTKEAAETALYK